jgi:organic radical activating enzyme
MEDKFYCPAPWHGAFITPWNSSVCCMHNGIQTDSLNFFTKSEYIKNVRSSFVDGNLDHKCKFCNKTDLDGGYSLAKVFMKTYQSCGIEIDPEFDLTNIDSEHNLKYIELRFSNKCNFACRMCAPEWSNRIDEEATENIELKKYYRNLSNVKTTNTTNIDELTRHIPHLKWIMLSGGEPMIGTEIVDFLHKISDFGCEENITIHINTNASTINYKVIEFLKKFKNVVIILSIDAIGTKAEYIRNGTLWSHIDKNLQIYNDIAKNNPNFLIGFNLTLSSYAIFGLTETLEYLSKFRNSKCEWLGTNLSQGFTNPYNLSDEFRTLAINELSNSMNKLLDVMPDSSDIKDFYQQLKSLQEVLQTQEPNKFEWEKFIGFTNDLDKIRNESFKDVFGFELK